MRKKKLKEEAGRRRHVALPFFNPFCIRFLFFLMVEFILILLTLSGPMQGILMFWDI